MLSKEGDAFGGSPSFSVAVVPGDGGVSMSLPTKEGPFSSAMDPDGFAVSASSSEGEDARRKFNENTETIVVGISKDPRLWRSDGKEVSFG